MIRGFCQAHDENPALFRFLLFVQHGQLGEARAPNAHAGDAVRTVLDEGIAAGEIPAQSPTWPRRSSSASCCSRSPSPPTAGCSLRT